MTNSPQIDGGDGGKRAMEIDGSGGGGGEAKRRKKEVVNGEEMKRVAELVLVLSAMGKMRGGRDPTVVETALMAEAKKKVVSLCEEFSPKDIIPKEAFPGVIEDLGLNRLKDHRLGFRHPKLSIADKISLSKRRMEESKAFAAQPTLYTSQQLQTGNGASNENRGIAPPVRVLTADKVGHASAGGNFQPSNSAVHTPVVQTPPVAQTPTAVHISAAATTPVAVSIPAPRSMVQTRSERAHIRSDGRQNGPSAVPQVPANYKGDQHTVRTGPAQMQYQPPSRVNIGSQSKVAEQSAVGNVGGPRRTAQPAVVHTPKPALSQPASGTITSMHHPGQGLPYTQPLGTSHHAEISKVVQRLLNPHLSQRPTWTSSSRDYMSKAHPCQFCKVIINEVETVVICDACEKAFHLECLQSHNVRGISSREWHCPKCVTMSHGKPFPPKYGRVTRNMNAPKGPSNTAVAHFSSEKKMEKANEKVNKPNVTTNGSVNVKTQTPTDTAAKSYGPNPSHGIDTGRKPMSVGIKNEVAPNMATDPNTRMGAAVEASLSTSTGSSSDKPPQVVVKSEVPHFMTPNYGFVPETVSSTPVVIQANSVPGSLPSSRNENDVDQRVSNIPESLPFRDSNGAVECNQRYSEERGEKDGVKQILPATDRVQDQAREIVETSEIELRNVDWIGEVDKVVDEKTFFRSCRINGVVYHVQNYVLFFSRTGKLTPLRLQGMWEDSQTSSKWLLVHRCYFPDDLPSEVGRPGAPLINEVYESIHDSCMKAGFVQGPCEVLPFRKFGEENDLNNPGSRGDERRGAVFVRNWFYDEAKGAFCPSAS